MKKYYQVFFVILFVFIGTTRVMAIDFLQAYEMAEKSDPDILAASFDYQAVLETRSQSRSALLPQISLDFFIQQGDRQGTSTSTSSTSNIGDYDSDGYSLTLSQSIYNHELYLILDQTDLSIASAAADFAAAKQALILRVAEAYFNVLGAEDNLAFAKSEKKAIGEQLEQTQRRFDVGLIAITDVKESQAQYDLSVAAQIQAENLLSTTRETLRSIIGEMPDSISKLAEKFPLLVPKPENIDTWVDTSKQNNFSLKAAQYAYDIAKKQVSIDRSGHYPSLGLNLSHEDSSIESDISDFDSEDTTITLNLSIPIYSGGLTNAKTKQAIANKERARSLREKAMRDTVKLSRDSYLGVTTSIAQVKANKQALISTQTAYEATQAGFEVGTRTAVEVLAVLRNQYAAERDYARARYNYILNILRLKQAAGILSIQDVTNINQWLRN